MSRFGAGSGTTEGTSASSSSFVVVLLGVCVHHGLKPSDCV